MNGNESAIIRRGLIKRTVIPIAVSLCVWSSLFIITLNLGWIGSPAVYRFLMNLSHTMLFIVIGFGGALYVYPVMYFRGASQGERILGCYAVPAAFIIKEMYRVSEFFTPGESLYYAASSMFLLLLFGQAGLMGISEMICRIISNKKTGERRPVITLVPCLCVVFSLAWLYILLIWGLGVHWFYIYQEGYKALFL